MSRVFESPRKWPTSRSPFTDITRSILQQLFFEHRVLTESMLQICYSFQLQNQQMGQTKLLQIFDLKLTDFRLEISRLLHDLFCKNFVNSLSEHSSKPRDFKYTADKTYQLVRKQIDKDMQQGIAGLSQVRLELAKEEQILTSDDIFKMDETDNEISRFLSVPNEVYNRRSPVKSPRGRELDGTGDVSGLGSRRNSPFEKNPFLVNLDGPGGRLDISGRKVERGGGGDRADPKADLSLEASKSKQPRARADYMSPPKEINEDSEYVFDTLDNDELDRTAFTPQQARRSASGKKYSGGSDRSLGRGSSRIKLAEDSRESMEILKGYSPDDDTIFKITEFRTGIKECKFLFFRIMKNF